MQVDFLSPHRPRTPRSPGQTRHITQPYRADNAEPRRSFDLRTKRLFEQLDTTERQAVQRFAKP